MTPSGTVEISRSVGGRGQGFNVARTGRDKIPIGTPADASGRKPCYTGAVTDTAPPLQFTRSRKVTRPWLRLMGGQSILVVLLLMMRYPPEDIFPSQMAVWVMLATRLPLIVMAMVLSREALAGFEETWTFSADGVTVASRTLFGRNQKRWPLGKAELRVQPEGFPVGYTLSVRIGKGEWMTVFRFDDKHVATRTAARIEQLIAVASGEICLGAI